MLLGFFLAIKGQSGPEIVAARAPYAARRGEPSRLFSRASPKYFTRKPRLQGNSCSMGLTTAMPSKRQPKAKTAHPAPSWTREGFDRLMRKAVSTPPFDKQATKGK